jgi:gliding motility-associated-like protein
VQITNPDGCTVTEEIVVVEKCEPLVLVPDAFTPNGDGTNETLIVRALFVIDYEIVIFNRWGEAVFASRNPGDEWDGTFRGQPVPVGSYAYKIIYRSEFFPEREQVVKRGGVMVLR